MRNLLIVVVSVLSICFLYGQMAQAVCTGGPIVFVCNTNAPNPDPNGIQQNPNNNNLLITIENDAGIDTRIANGGSGNQAIRTGSGDNQITVNSGLVAGQSIAISTKGGADIITVDDSEIRGLNNLINTQGGPDLLNLTDSELIQDPGNPNRGIETSSGDDTINVIRSNILAVSNIVIDTSSGNDTINLTDSTVIAGEPDDDEAIEMSAGNDKVTVLRSIIEGDESIDFSAGNDMLTMGTGADIRGPIDCGSGFDTLMFTMEVPEEAVGFFTSQILAQDPQDGSVTINGLFYEWFGCDLLVAQLVGVQNVRPIPTLSEWGLIALAGAMGVFGVVFAVRRRRVTA